jgi:hypothetical protein
LPLERAYAAPVTYNFQVDAGNAVATTIITDDHVCNNNPLGATITLMSTAAHGCALHVIKPSTAGPQNILDVWFNTPYAVGTAVTGTSLKVHLREKTGGVGPETWTAGFTLMHVDAAGTVTGFSGPEVSRVVGNSTDVNHNIVLTGQSATIPAGNKLGLLIRAISGTSSNMEVYYGSAADVAGTGTSGVLIVDESVLVATTTSTPVSSSSTSTYGTAVTFTSTVSPATVTGNVELLDGATVIGSGALSNVAGVMTASVNTTATQLTAGSHSMAARYVGNISHAGSTSTAMTQTVGQKSLTVTGITAGGKTYDGTTDAVLVTGSAALAGNLDAGNVVLNTAGAIGTFVPNGNAGVGKTVQISGLSISGSAIGNYLLAQPVATATIGAKPATVTANPQSKVYGVADPTLTYAVVPPLLGIDSLSGSLSRAAGENFGTYAISRGTLANANYNLSITKAVLTVTADNKTVAFGVTPVFTMTYGAFAAPGGVLPVDTASVLDTAPACGVGP